MVLLGPPHTLRTSFRLVIAIQALYLPFSWAWEPVPDPPLHYHQGQWLYQAANGSQLYGHFLYTSPMGKVCKQNLTIVAASVVCGNGVLVPPSFAASKQCLPQALEVAAMLVDSANADHTHLNDTCLQVSSVHLQTYEEYFFRSSASIHDLVSTPPTKHGFIGSSVGRWSDYADAIGLPVVETIEVDVIRQDVPRSFYRVKSDMSWVLPHVMRQLLPARIAVLVDDATARAALTVIQRTADLTHTAVDLVEVASNFMAEEAAQAVVALRLVRAMVARQLRYLLFVSTSSGLWSVLLCALYKERVHRHIQVVGFGGVNNAHMWVENTRCISPRQNKEFLSQLTYEGGWLGISGMLHYYLEASVDHVIGLETSTNTSTEPGSHPKDLEGNALTATSSVAYQVVEDCADDSARVNRSETLRQLLRKGTGDTVSCQEVAPLGQQQWPLLREAAQLCPISSCKYNPLAPACQASCACEPAAPGRSGRPCTALAQLPSLSGTTARSARCEGQGCRPLAFAASASSLGDRLFAYTLTGMGFCPPPNVCGTSARALVWAAQSAPMADAFWSLVEAYRCVERRHGAEGLKRLAQYGYRGGRPAEDLRSCLVEEVDFMGTGGRISFGYFQSPQPGHTPPIITAPHPKAPQGFVTEGIVLSDRLVLAHRSFWRSNLSACSFTSNTISPGVVCPSGAGEEYLAERDGVPSQALLPGFPATCAPGSHPLALGEQDFTPEGREVHVFECVPCPEGTFKAEAGPHRCSPCQPGFFAHRGQTSCTGCSANTYSVPPAPNNLLRDGRTQAFGPSGCLPCGSGLVAESGSSQCSPCSPGTARSPSLPTCGLCPAGTFQDSYGSDACLSCQSFLPGSTSARGAAQLDECLCPAGTVARPGVGCEVCGRGLDCPGGNALPLQQGGFWGSTPDQASASAYSMVRCRSSLECPAGPIGTCAPGRHGLACSSCLPSHYKVGTGSCLRCGEDGYSALVGAAVAAVAALTVLFCSVSMDVSTQPLTAVTLAAVMGQATSALQVLSALRQLQIQWMEPVRSILQFLSVMALDLDVVHLTCALPEDNPISRTAAQLLAFPCCCLMLAAISLAISHLPCRAFIQHIDTKASLANACGFVALTFYISLTLLSLAPLQCSSNPNSSHSMTGEPGVICWSSSTHRWLVVLATVGIVTYPVSMFAAASWVTLRYRAMVSTGRGLQLLRCWRFLFNRFTAERHWYGVCYLARNAAVAFVPLVFASSPSLEIVAMCLLLQGSTVMQARCWPWRTVFANTADMLSGIAICTFLACSMLLHTLNQADAQATLQWLLMLALGALLLAVPLSLLRVFRKRLCVGKHYAIFLCHHKEGAGCLSRLLKMVLALLSPARTFLDSDELEDLDLIFDIVRSDVQTLVVVRSSEVLKRMWCAGEIATAYRNGIPIVLVQCDECEALNQDSLADLATCLTLEQQSVLMTYGITPDLVREAYRHLCSLNAIVLPRFGTLQEKVKTVQDVLTLRNLPRKKFAGFMEVDYQSEVWVLGAVGDPEAFSTCEITATILQFKLELSTMVVRSVEQAQAACGELETLVIVLTKGVLEDPVFAAVLVQALGRTDSSPPQVVTILADQGFAFPSPSFLDRLAASEGLGSVGGEELSRAYRSVLSVLALPLSPRGSEGLIQLQLGEVAQRLRALHTRTIKPMKSAKSTKQTEKADGLPEGGRLLPPTPGRVNLQDDLSHGPREDETEDGCHLGWEQGDLGNICVASSAWSRPGHSHSAQEPSTRRE